MSSQERVQFEHTTKKGLKTQAPIHGEKLSSGSRVQQRAHHAAVCQLRDRGHRVDQAEDGVGLAVQDLAQQQVVFFLHHVPVLQAGRRGDGAFDGSRTWGLL